MIAVSRVRAEIGQTSTHVVVDDVLLDRLDNIPEAREHCASAQPTHNLLVLLEVFILLSLLVLFIEILAIGINIVVRIRSCASRGRLSRRARGSGEPAGIRGIVFTKGFAGVSDCAEAIAMREGGVMEAPTERDRDALIFRPARQAQMRQR